MKAAVAYGSTAEDRPTRVIDKPVPVIDLHATILRAVGIPPDLAYEVDRRPVYVTKDGQKTRPGIVCLNAIATATT